MVGRGTRMALVLVAALGSFAPLAKGARITFTAMQGDLEASATFDTMGANLTVILTNISMADVEVPADVLTALFFDSTVPLNLTPVSAVLGPGSVVHFGGTDPGGVVGGEWAYRQAVTNGPMMLPYSITSVGLSLDGSEQMFPGTNLQGPVNEDGLQYGITSAGDNMATGNAPVTGGNALIQNEVVFTLSGIPRNFDPSQSITFAFWQYGTDFSEPGFGVPEPATAALLGVGALALIRRRRPC